MVVLSDLSQGSSSSSSTHGHRYDVFLSFRGLDTRNSFTAYLHKALMDANIATFLDDEEIEIGDDLKPELQSAIKACRASVIVLSMNYASSTWCLDELVLILEQRMTSNHVVFPIFYHVEPTDVRKQQSSFGDAMAKHREKMEAETDANKRSKWSQKIASWKKALREVADLRGKDVNGRRETEFIEEIVKDIYSRLCISSRRPLPQIFGMDNSIEFLTSWLKDASSHTADILTILGMGGIGKTSLAKYVYLSHFRDFDTSSFIEDISRRCNEKLNGLIDLQKELCADILKPSLLQVADASTYTSMINNAVSSKKVFLVLDDIDNLDQLNALLGSNGFHAGSKIIITTKDAWLTESCELFKMRLKPKHATHELKGLSYIQSQQLFCFHAFRSYSPKVGYEEVSEKLVKYCEGHPMALKILGRSLYNRDIAYWEGYIKEIKKENCSPINNVLRMSFDSLSFKNDKELFKHLACFFVGMDRDVTETILKACDIETRSGITNLIDKCLLNIEWNNKLMMHQLLQEMGRFVVREESPEKPWKRSRLWCHEESFKVLKQKKGKGNLLGLALDMQMIEKEKSHSSFELKTDAMSNMVNLMLLQLNYVHINGSYENLPKELRWLCMHGFPLKSVPSDLPMENLVALDMSYSNIESFGNGYKYPRLQKRQKLDGLCLKDKSLFGSLKVLNLSFSHKLRSLGGFDELPALERLILTNCTGLFEVCDSIGECVELVHIDMSYCNKLEKLPKSLGMLKKVKTLLLDGCNLGESRIRIAHMDSSNNICTNKLTSSSFVLEAIPNDSKFFVISLPSLLVTLSLKDNNLSAESFPVDFSCLSMLKKLYLDENPLVSLPYCVRSLPRLEILSMINCYMLKSLEHPPHTLRKLFLFSDHKPSLRKILFDPKMSPLTFFINNKMFPAPSLEIEGMIKIQPMASVEKKVLHCLGWTNLDISNERRLRTDVEHYWPTGLQESEIQMYYEFGIFSTIYEGEEMPSWITDRSTGPSMLFTIPSSPKKLRGLNLCYVQSPLFHDVNQSLKVVDNGFFYLPTVTIDNITKNRTWTYDHYIDIVNVSGDSLIVLSHWMFGMNEMEDGDHITLTVGSNQVIKECGVSLVYDDDGEEKEDVLGYYKSWNHIIGGDLTGFQSTTGKYDLTIKKFFAFGFDDISIFSGDEIHFRAFSQQKSSIPEGLRLG
ncbi:unnamed protein product [Lactuca saligna]|uniref:TIR domain-containing protein n=1 Tax=Lactuca saligna TaxID=75948 RepID=A0AA35UU88_LACSI|nr:unnamed protein product [Lactuca saligna]